MNKTNLKNILLALLLMVVSWPAATMAQTDSKCYMVVTKTDGTVKAFNFEEVESVTWDVAEPEPEPEPLPGSSGTGKANINGAEVDVKWVQLWKDGPMFAEYNVGATSATEYGGYYAWGGSQDKIDDHSTGTSSLTGDNDTATKLWGRNWRMPTDIEYQALNANCDIEWLTINGVTGLKYTGRGDYATNSVFLPTAGYFVSKEGYVTRMDNGRYWSSISHNSICADYLFFISNQWYVTYAYFGDGYSVRAVYDPQPEPEPEPEPLPGSLGKGKASINGVQTDVEWVQLWENGPKFAKYNVGVTDGKTESYGGYYTWGGSIDNDPNSSCNKGDKVLTGTDDTATNIWGNNWRMPTAEELQALIDNCTRARTNVNGVAGLIFTGKGDYATNSVFLPTAGGCNYGEVLYSNDYGNYWSSTPYDSDYAYYLMLYSSASLVKKDHRIFEYSIRAVYDPQIEPEPEPELDPLPGSFGTAKANINGTQTDVEWIQLWENSPKFAKYNVGVTDGKAESYGGYYWWGGSIDNDPNELCNEGNEVLTGADDTATNLWGNNWRMPTQAELNTLIANCNVKWTTVNGVTGRKFTGKGAYAGNSVFLPAAGYCYLGNFVDYYGNYWSSTPDDTDSENAYYLDFNSDNQKVLSDSRYISYPVRAVYDPR